MAEAIVSGIYKIENTINGKCYVGSAVNFATRFRNHRSQLKLGRHHSIKLQRSWAKHGGSVFVFYILEFVEDLCSLISREQHWIDLLGPEYNIAKTAGSQMGFRHSLESIKKMSASHKLTPPPDDETRRLISLNHRRHQTEETKKLIGDIHRGKTRGPRSKESIEKQRLKVIGRPKPPRTAEHSRKISEALTGKKQSPDHVAKSALGRTGMRHSEETKKKLSERARSRDPECYARGAATRAKISPKKGVPWTSARRAAQNERSKPPSAAFLLGAAQ